MKIFYFYVMLFYPVFATTQVLDWYSESWIGGRFIDVHSNGEVTISGRYDHNNASINGVNLNSSGLGTYKFDPFVARYSKEGELVWVKTGLTNFYGFQSDVNLSTDSENSVIINGYFSDELKFGETTLVSDGGQNVFIAKYDNIGNILWAKAFQSQVSNFTYKVKTDAQDNIYMTIEYSANIIIDNHIIEGELGVNNIGVVKFDKFGNLIWHYSFQASNSLGFDVTENGEVVIAGNSFNYFNVDEVNEAIPAGGSNFYVIKLKTDGSTAWFKSDVSNIILLGMNLILDKSGNIYLLMQNAKEFIFYGQNHETLLKSEKILKLDSNGKLLWLNEFLGEKSQCNTVPSFVFSNDRQPCIACLESDLVDSLNYQNLKDYGLTVAFFDTLTGELIEKLNYPKLPHAEIVFDKYGSMFSFGGFLSGIQFNDAPIKLPNDGIYIYKTRGKYKNLGSGIVLFPNPSKDLFNFQIDNDSEIEYEIKIYDLNGKEIVKNRIFVDGFKSYTIDANNWSNGVYLCNIIGGSQVFQFRMVKF